MGLKVEVTSAEAMIFIAEGIFRMYGTTCEPKDVEPILTIVEVGDQREPETRASLVGFKANVGRPGTANLADRDR